MPRTKRSTPPSAKAKAPAPAPAPATSLAELARARPGLVVGGGLLVGLLAGALIPRGAAGRIARGATSAAVLGGELGLALARQARDGAAQAAGEATDHVRSGAARAGAGARRLQLGTMAAAGQASVAGLELARAALNFLAARKR